MTKKEIYQKILDEIEKHIIESIKVQEIGEIFNINDLPQDSESDYIKVDDYERAIRFYEAGGNYISFPDDGRQPEDEYLYNIRFPGGAYTFGDHNPKDVFREFFEELKTFNPKYSDTTSGVLYFSPENASKIHYAYNDIREKYLIKAQEEYKAQRKQKLLEELIKLEGGENHD